MAKKYGRFVPGIGLQEELKVWRQRWSRQDNKPVTATDALNGCDEEVFPNIFTYYITKLTFCWLEERAMLNCIVGGLLFFQTSSDYWRLTWPPFQYRPYRQQVVHGIDMWAREDVFESEPNCEYCPQFNDRGSRGGSCYASGLSWLLAKWWWNYWTLR